MKSCPFWCCKSLRIINCKGCNGYDRFSLEPAKYCLKGRRELHLFKLFCEYMEDKYGELDTVDDYVSAVRYNTNWTRPNADARRLQSFGHWLAWEEVERGKILRPRRIKRPFPVIRLNHTTVYDMVLS